MKLPVLNIKGKETGREVTLDKSVFGVAAHDHVVYLAVKQFRANNRQGTSKSKERGEIVGSTRKIKKQKGTGTARAGSIKNPLFRGGGRVFARRRPRCPSPRHYRPSPTAGRARPTAAARSCRRHHRPCPCLLATAARAPGP